MIYVKNEAEDGSANNGSDRKQQDTHFFVVIVKVIDKAVDAAKVYHQKNQATDQVPKLKLASLENVVNDASILKKSNKRQSQHDVHQR